MSKNVIIVSRRMSYITHVARMGEKMNAYRTLVGKPEGKRPRRRWMENIKMDFAEIVYMTGFIWLKIGANKGLLSTQ
jgi:hypothetical protein